MDKSKASGIKGPFAPVRDGVLEHHREMTFSQIAVFHRLLNLANREKSRGCVGLCPGVGVRTLALGMKKDRGAIRRAVQRLEEKNYIKRTSSGLMVLNFTGDEPQEHPANGSSKHHGAKNTMVPKAPLGGSSKHHGGVAESTSKGVLRAPGIKEETETKRDGDEEQARSEPVEVPLPIPVGIRFSKISNRVEMDEDFRSWLREHLEELATSEGLRMLSRAEFQDSWGRLNGHLIGNPRKRGTKTLRPMSVNWFENDLRRHGQRPSKGSAMDAIRDYEQEASIG